MFLKCGIRQLFYLIQILYFNGPRSVFIFSVLSFSNIAYLSNNNTAACLFNSLFATSVLGIIMIYEDRC